ncbi:MAG: hypothetical protein V1767_08155 [Chloroflexota bacterium]
MAESELVKKIHELYETKYQGISSDEIEIYLFEQNLKVLEQLDKETRALNRYTKVLIGLTFVLAVSELVRIF